MKYLLWKAQVKAYIEANYPDSDTWETWTVWREEFHAHKSPAQAAIDVYTLVFR